MKLSTGLFLVFVGILAASGCRDSNSIAGANGTKGPLITPTPSKGSPITPTPASSLDAGQWDLTDQVVGDSGPDFCIWTAKVGMVFHGTYTITRNGGSLSFVPADIFDWWSYTATLQGTSFTATNGPYETSAQYFCTHYWTTTSLSGSFSPDGKQLTATEIWSFTLDSGQVKTVTFQWSAVRR